jgi:hypothetical protein
LYTAFSYIEGFPVSVGECALQGITRLEVAIAGQYLQHLPRSIVSIAFGDALNQTLEGVSVSLPSNLRSLTSGNDFNQTLEGVSLPSTISRA